MAKKGIFAALDQRNIAEFLTLGSSSILTTKYTRQGLTTFLTVLLIPKKRLPQMFVPSHGSYKEL